MAPRIDGAVADYLVQVSLISRMGSRTRASICSQWVRKRSVAGRYGVIGGNRPASAASQLGAAPASVALHRGSPRPGDERLAETEGFEPSIGLYNPITV